MRTPISVVIPIAPYHADTAQRAIASAELQTYPVEVVPVHDSDGRGAGWARNRGVERASGDLLVFLDADDELHPQFVEKTLPEFAQTGRYIYTDWTLAEGGLTVEKQVSDFDLGMIRKIFFLHAVTTLLPRPFYEAAGGFDETMTTWEDVDFYYKMILAGYCGWRLAEPLITYHADDGQRRIRGLNHQEQMRDLIMTRYFGRQIMGCRSCGGSKITTTAPGVTVSYLAEEEPPDASFQLAVYARAGARTFRGIATGIMYPRMSEGTLFWAHPDDLRYEPKRKGGMLMIPAPMPETDITARVRTMRDKVAAEFGVK